MTRVPRTDARPAGSGAADRGIAESRLEGTPHRLQTFMSLSRAVAEGLDLEDTLGVICATAAELVDASAVAIILRAEASGSGLVVAGSSGLSEHYAEHLNRTHPLELGRGPTGLAVQEARAVCISNVLEEPIFEPWRSLAVHEGFRALIAMPLRLGDDEVMGVLNTYRPHPGAWSTADINLLTIIADHAAIAVRIAQLLDETRRQVQGLSLMVRSLRAQAHEHQNHLHAIYGLLAVDDVATARRMIALAEDQYHTAHASVTSRIENPAVAGLLVAQRMLAANIGIRLSVNRRSRLAEAAPPLTDLDYITILGNLIQNAIEAVATVPPSERRIAVHLSQDTSRTVFRVRDWGPGIDPAERERIFEPTFTSKPDHAGVGLSTVRGIVTRARGVVDVGELRGRGVSFTVTIPSRDRRS
jgi:signal transduction histidine kinase